jgi:mono/diheme cytochrome c family protein
MNLRSNVFAPLIATAVAAASLGSAFGLAVLMQHRPALTDALTRRETSHEQHLDPQLVAGGHKLFLMNCAHCHADDATGDEGPDLHGLRKSGDRLRSLIKNGIKGEMPRFNEKLADTDLDALVAFLDSLR